MHGELIRTFKSFEKFHFISKYSLYSCKMAKRSMEYKN
jgi:hypothetical protein